VNQTRAFSLALALLAAAACKRAEAPTVTPDPAPAPVAQPTPAANPTPPTPPTPPAAPQPRVELTAPEYNLVASLTGGVFDLAIRGAGEYHVNEQYPTAVTLQVDNGAVAKPTMRKDDAAEFTAALAHFTQPVQSTGAGTVVRGSVRFGVCRAEQCGFFNREFALAAQ
jgi:hypothetical protein